MLLINDSGIKRKDVITIKLNNGREVEAEVVKLNIRSLWCKLCCENPSIIKRKYRHIRFTASQYIQMRVEADLRSARRLSS